jgi:arginine decarboxylase
MELIEKWKTTDAVETYGIRHWSKGYFGINKSGHVTVHPNKNPEQAIDLKELLTSFKRAAFNCRYFSASPTS